MNRELETRLDWLEHEQIVDVLSNAGINCYDYESTDDLLEALKSHIEDGTISEYDIP